MPGLSHGISAAAHAIAVDSNASLEHPPRADLEVARSQGGSVGRICRQRQPCPMISLGSGFGPTVRRGGAPWSVEDG